VLLGPLLWSFDQEAAGFAAATALFATVTVLRTVPRVLTPAAKRRAVRVAHAAR
jgi:hypothetical protein